MEERFKFRHVHAITGTFVLVVVGALIAILMLAGRSQRWFIGNATLRIVMPEAGAAGIRQGSEVYFLGTLVGSVSDVILDATGRMEAQASIRRDFFRFVREDSSAVVKKKFEVAGDAYFEITRGQGRLLPEKDATIDCRELPGTMETAIAEVRNAALPVLKKLSAGLGTWTALGSNLITTRERLDQLILRVDSLAADLQQGKGTAGQLIIDTALSDDAQQLLARADEAMSELRAVATNLNVAVKNVQNGTTRLPEITDNVAAGAKDLPGLVEQTQVSMRELQRLVEAVQRHWLVRKYVNKTNPPRERPWPGSEEPAKMPVRVFRSPRDSGR